MNDQLVEQQRGIKEQARRVLEEAFPNNDDNLLRELVSDTFVNHEAPPGTPPGLGGISFYMHMLAAAFSDQRWEIHKVLAEGDTVVMYCTHSGRHTGDFFGVPATGRAFAYKQMHMVRVVDGKGVEHWAVRDDASLMRQLTEGNGLSARP
ncbi:ester cyclase [Mycetocola sp. 2940]|uniref:ester cyclase n=1 Tax=Mycetocola sp. 2940 TaxID=3156452 RepID=UPI00339ABF9F